MTYCPQTYVVSLIAMGMSIDYIAHSARCFFTTHRHHHTHHTRASNGARVGSNDANITTYHQKRKDGKGHENDDGLEVLKQTMAEIRLLKFDKLTHCDRNTKTELKIINATNFRNCKWRSQNKDAAILRPLFCI